ncbi:hypothetical protein AALO_G00157910 [Alosa alosa]|uniref:IQ motif and SEC7 domain-containing protein 3 n=1 Tax=Alosa alosa TaxID=278164 RepID=A0AAV6GFL8_9TELE|nr:IQ motif and SEC7 domain-containing protein 3 [Alosa alosa]KAG5273983.1 hypothetical protein AALO_G00157910 [Alosa alosa]
MASLLENPVQAVLYLKELTAIVQNQQSLIQTQRHRIDILERKLDDLVVENKQLRETNELQHHPPHHHQAQPGQLPQAEQSPSIPQQEMQLVPASTLSPSPEDSPEDSERRQGCKALVPQTPSTLTRAGARAHKSESQTVLHQFCCPAPEAPEREAICCSESPALLPSGGKEDEAGQKRKSSQPDASTCAHSPQYNLTTDLEETQIEDLERKYGGPLIARRAARKIQTAFRQYQLSRNYEKIRNSMSERREPRRMSVRRVRLPREGFSAEQALVEGCKLMGIPLTHSASAPSCSGGTLTNLEDTFTEQVQSLARSIDEALSTWSTIRPEEGPTGEGGGGGGEEGCSGAGAPPSRGDGGLLVDPDTIRVACGENLPRSASKLMLAFRDVTVQIDNRNYRLSSSAVLESVALGNSKPDGPPQGPPPPPPAPSESRRVSVQSEGEPEFPAPPSREEMEEEGVDGDPSGVEAEMGRPGGRGSRRSSQVRPEAEAVSGGSSTSTSGQSACETMVLSLPRPHCQDTNTCGTLSTDTARKRLYRIGLNLFNLNPDKGIEFLISRGFIPDTPIGVAHFLLQRKGLSRQMIGEFLGNAKKQFNRDVLDCVVDEMDFSGLELDEALRKFQAHIRVQGEAQKVERLIEAFSQRYCMCNPDVVQQFHNPDTIFILAFAVVLLNTDMYSPNIKPERKMLLEDFIRNLRGVDDGADIPREMVAGIYERIQQRELRSNEDHVTYVSRVEQSILGMKTILAVPHRRLVCCSRLYEVTDVNKPQKQASHQREVFLFNDLLVILKLCPKKKSAATYTFCKAMGLLGMQFHLFENEYYPHGITVLSPFCSEKRQVVSFSAPNADELLKFVEDLRESILEVAEMENIRIEWELERQQGIRSQPPKTNQNQMEIHIGQGTPTGNHEYYEKSGNNTVEVSIHNRLQTYQLASPQSLSSPVTSLAGVHPLAVLPSQAIPTLPSLSPLDTLIQCQQIVKVIVVDATGRGRVEAFLSQSPAHRLIQSADSTPVRSREGGADGKGGSNPPPPPPYHHPHQYCPPTPPPQHHLLSRHRYSSRTRSLV